MMPETKTERITRDIDGVSAFYLDGRTLKETAERYGCSERTLRDIFRACGVPTSYEERTKRLHRNGWFCPGCRQIVPREGWHGGTRGFRPSQCWCKECENERRRDRYHDNRLKEREYAVARRPKRSGQARANRRRLRSEILRYYGGCCACCGEATYEFLALDHIQGGGRRHRNDLIASGIITTEQYCKWIRESGFPPIYRVLCHNCNLAIGHHRVCPHQGVIPQPDLELLTGKERKNYLSRRSRRELRMSVLAGYGGECACCGESTYEFLAIDHVNGGGKKHAGERVSQNIDRIAYLKHIVADGFPPDFRLLCHNCNMALGFYGCCPHTCPI